jgi:hypothetical protein
MVSGALCDVFQAGIDFMIYSFLDVYWSEGGRTTVSWTLSYTLSIMIRHQSHRLLVFGDYDGGYLVSLARTYMTYSSAIVISMIANHTLVGYFGLRYRVAWIATMLFTGIYNYFTLKATWRVKKDPVAADKKAAGGSGGLGSPGGGNSHNSGGGGGGNYGGIGGGGGGGSSWEGGNGEIVTSGNREGGTKVRSLSVHKSNTISGIGSDDENSGDGKV